MRIHLPGLPHTVTDEAHSHCAFTGKIQKFPAMLATLPGQPYEVIHYGVEGADVACEHVSIMSRGEQLSLMGDVDDRAFMADRMGGTDSPLFVEFNRRLRAELMDRATLSDLVMVPFGYGHHQALKGLPYTLVESGIGYDDLYPSDKIFRVFESYAWLHYHQGKAGRWGKNYEWVIPNYFDVDAWEFDPAGDPDTVVYFGRVCDTKGLPTVVEIARARPDLRFVICGQGDPAPYLTLPNIEYRPPISGRARSAFLGRARCVLMPSTYVEPFGGVAVEAMMCGTPVLASPWGAFTETLEDQVTGYRCHTLGDWLAGLDGAVELDREYISARARRLYGYDRIATMYDRTFRQIADLRGEGWYSPRSTFRPDR